MNDVIDSIRGLRNQTLTYERAMSDLTVAIGNIERLADLTPEQLERLVAAASRLSKTVKEAGNARG